jgi:hypothetical protein
LGLSLTFHLIGDEGASAAQKIEGDVTAEEFVIVFLAGASTFPIVEFKGSSTFQVDLMNSGSGAAIR